MIVDTYPARKSIAVPLVILLSLLVCASSVWAAPNSFSRFNLERNFFTPEAVMENQEEIGLSAEQKEALIREVQGTQSDLVPWQFELDRLKEALRGPASENRVDEEQVLKLAQEMMEVETKIRTRHLAMLIRIKNLLSTEQQEKLSSSKGRTLRGLFPQR